LSTIAAWAAAAALAAQIGCSIANADAPNGSGTAELAQEEVEHKPDLCTRLLPAETIKFTGLYPAIEQRLPLSSFKGGQIVEIDPRTMTPGEARAYVKSLKAFGARVSIYLNGGHCDIDADCDRLPKSVELGSTGSWHWDRSERRILNVTHPSVLSRLAKG